MANPVGFKGHGRGIKPISHLYYLLKEQGRSFYNVLNNPIFSHSGLAGLNDHSAVEVCEKLAAVLAEQGETDALVEVDKVRQDLLGSVDYIPSSKPEHPTQDSKASSEGQDAENGGSSSSPLKPAKRTENEQAPFKLGSLVANLDAVQSQRTVSTDPYVRQDLLEESAYDAALWQSLHEHDHLEKIGLGTKIRMKGSFIQENMARWRAALTERLEEDFKKAAEPKTPVKGFYGGFSGDENLKNLLGLLTPANLAHVTVVEILRATSIFTGIVDGVRLARAVVLLGRAVETEYGAHAWKALHPDLYEQKVRKIASEERKAHAIRNFMQEQGIAAGAAKEARIQGYGDEADELLKIDDPEERQIIEEARKRAMPWTQKMRAKVGGYLLKQLLETAYVERTAAKRDGSGEIVTEKQPAFWQSYQYFRSQRVGIIKLNPAVAEKMDSDRLGSVAFPRFLPMLVKPKPWTGFNSGGYRIHSSE